MPPRAPPPPKIFSFRRFHCRIFAARFHSIRFSFRRRRFSAAIFDFFTLLKARLQPMAM
jgi:hypothetical protein